MYRNGGFVSQVEGFVAVQSVAICEPGQRQLILG